MCKLVYSIFEIKDTNKFMLMAKRESAESRVCDLVVLTPLPICCKTRYFACALSALGPLEVEGPWAIAQLLGPLRNSVWEFPSMFD